MIKPGEENVTIVTPNRPKPMEVLDLTTGETRTESPNYVPKDFEAIVLDTTDVTPPKNTWLWILGIAAAYYAFK